MVRNLLAPGWLLTASMACLAVTYGCSNSATEPAPTESTPQASAEHDEGHQHAESGEGESDDPLAGLSAEDRKLAVAQKVCPVGGGNLGDMGTPVKIEHEGKVVFLCCEHCREPFNEDPAKFLAKLEKPADGETDPAAPEPTTP